MREPAFWVVGAPRSGTSAVTRILTLLGAVAGDPRNHLQAGPAGNPHGYFEQNEVIALNDELLAALGGHRLFPPPTDPGWERDPKFEPLRGAATELLERLLQPGPPVIKDPRLSFTLPFWIPLLRTPRAVVCVRHPDEVLASQDRGFHGVVDRAHMVRRWLSFTASALVNSATIPRVLVRYEELVSRPAEQVDRLAELFCEPLPDPAARAAASASIDPELRHAADGAFELSEGARALYDTLSTGDPETALETATRLARDLLEAQREDFDWENARERGAALAAAILQRRRAG